VHKSIVMAGVMAGMLVLLSRQFALGAEQSTSISAAGNRACEALGRADLSTLQDAPTHITRADWIGRHGDTPSYCRVHGYVEPRIGFEILLPTARWNEKFIELGCGGACGVLDEWACEHPLGKGYACIVSDMGHRGESGDWRWARNNLRARVDFGFRSTHVTAIAGKALTRLYYHRPPRESYFSGCSTGGRQAMVEAERFPWDFNGIIAGAPPLNFAANSLAQLWASLAATSTTGKAVLTPAAVRLVHQAVLAQCDLDDGVRDGVVGNPSACAVDAGRLLCRAGQSKGCLTDEQVAATKKIYAGPFAATDSLSKGGYMPGSELEWIGPDLAADGGRGFLYSYNLGKFRYAFFPDSRPGWQPAAADFRADHRRLGLMEALYSASNPDLRQFKRNGGKLLMYQGWSDPFEPPVATTEYYDTVERLMGGKADTQDFYRLFMVPGMGHCTGGEGAWAIDYLTYLDEWVEEGRAPARLIGWHVDLPDDPVKSQQIERNLRFPLRAPQATFSRPVYPYPLRAKYDGTGDPTRAESFAPIG